MKISLLFQEITLRTEFPGSNFLLPIFLTGGKLDFQVANLLLATVNFEPCSKGSRTDLDFWDCFGREKPTSINRVNTER